MCGPSENGRFLSKNVPFFWTVHFHRLSTSSKDRPLLCFWAIFYSVGMSTSSKDRLSFTLTSHLGSLEVKKIIRGQIGTTEVKSLIKNNPRSSRSFEIIGGGYSGSIGELSVISSHFGSSDEKIQSHPRSFDLILRSICRYGR